jgi:L-threonylcarbamoyladenylate synthase
MERVIVDPDHPDPAGIAAAVAALRTGSVVAFPTDTLYGLAVDPRSDTAVARLFALKGRPAHMAVPIVAADVEQAARAGAFGPRERRLADAFWPGPLSIVVPATSAIARRVTSGEGTVAIRVPAHAVARRLAAAFGYCVTATSANTSGQAAAASADEVALGLPEVDLLLDGGPAPGGAPSTIIAFDGDVPVLLRAGAVAWDRVIKSLQ